MSPSSASAACLVVMLPALLISEIAQAQQVIVQQPVVNVFRLDTAVSVPDRGGILLGGVDQGAVGRQQYGPMWWGSSLGSAYSTSRASVHVWIHDLEAMDTAILAVARQRSIIHEGRPSQSGGRTVPTSVELQTERARQQMLRQHHARR